MNIFNNLKNYDNKIPCVAALGNFDGVHIGHKELLKLVCKEAKSNGLKSLAVTFDKHPANYLTGRNVSPFITDNEQKARLISEIGIENIMFLPFNDEISNLSPEDFVKIYLKEKLNVKIAVCGFHYGFGKGGAGTAHDLIELCKKYDIKVIVLPPVLSDNVIASSSYIRNLLQLGDMETAAHFLGRNFCVNLTVVVGKRIGRKMGIPTINQDFLENSIVPSYGVYATYTYIENEKNPSVTNIGVRPTINNFSKENMETHIIGKRIYLYSQKVKVEFIKKIRDEIRFSNITSLKKQIENDINKVLEITK